NGTCEWGVSADRHQSESAASRVRYRVRVDAREGQARGKMNEPPRRDDASRHPVTAAYAPLVTGHWPVSPHMRFFHEGRVSRQRPRSDMLLNHSARCAGATMLVALATSIT